MAVGGGECCLNDQAPVSCGGRVGLRCRKPGCRLLLGSLSHPIAASHPQKDISGVLSNLANPGSASRADCSSSPASTLPGRKQRHAPRGAKTNRLASDFESRPPHLLQKRLVMSLSNLQGMLSAASKCLHLYFTVALNPGLCDSVEDQGGVSRSITIITLGQSRTQFTKDFYVYHHRNMYTTY